MRINTRVVKIGKIKIGGNNPIAIQSMTDTDTSDIESTVKQCMQLADAGSDLVRITVNTDKAGKAVPEIRKTLDKKGYKNLPLIGDLHFNGDKILSDNPKCAAALDKFRINPGNVGEEKKFEKIIKIAKDLDKSVRIGVNSGSIDQKLLEENNYDCIKAMVESALRSAKLAEKNGLPKNKIVLSIKTTNIQSLINANELLVEEMKNRNSLYAIHLGLTEAGSGLQGVVSSTTALAILLNKGIGDTIRVSITPLPGEARTREVEVCKELLQSLNLRKFHPVITSCPGCGRTDREYFQKMNIKIKEFININYKNWEKRYPDINKLKIAIMGCVVNGPGEARNSDIAIHLPGKTEEKTAQLYINGKFNKTLKGNITQKFTDNLQKYIKEKFKS